MKLNPEDYSIIVRVLNFDKVSKSEKKFIDRDTFMKNVINNLDVQEKMRVGQLPGLFTHSSRDSKVMDRSIPYVDNIIRDTDFCNFTAALDVDGSDVYAGINIINYGKGLLLKEMIRARPDKEKYPISVSMATKSRVTPTAYHVEEFLGIDFTQRPDLDSAVISTNFSQAGERITRIIAPLEIISINDNPKTAANFSSTLEDTTFSVTTLDQTIKEMKFQPYRILMNRMYDVVQWCNNKPQEDISKNIAILKNYIESYIYSWILSMMNNPSTDFNLILGLRLSKYVKDHRVLSDLQRTLKIVKMQLSSKGIIQPQYQKKLNDTFQMTMTRLYEYINDNLSNSGKFFR
jgi:hypothetical protein